MKKKILIATIYLSGVVAAYLNAKRLYMAHHDGVWTKGVRFRVIPVVMFSWLSVCAEEAGEAITSHGDDSPAAW